jgi:hypothetical protein
VFVDIRQVIPTPEAESFMIGMAQKEAEEQSTSGGTKAILMIRKAFWTMALENSAPAPALFNNISPSTDHWLAAGSGISGVPFELIFSQKDARVQLNIRQILRWKTPGV